ncbi:uncharacterized protein LOC120331942 [Styela clava]
MDSTLWNGILLLFAVACAITSSLGADCPTEFENCTCLQNTLTCSLKTYWSLPKAVVFDLSMTYYHFDHNNFTIIKSTYFTNFVSMSYLSLRENKISTIEEESFHNNLKLSHIDLSYNRLEYLSVNLFKRLTSLQNIYLGNNQLRRIETDLFTHLTTLEVVRINNNKLEFLGKDVFIHSPNLRELYLESNNLEIPEKNWLESFNTTAKEYFVYLDDNPWSCDCRMKEFFLWGKNHPWFTKHDRDGISVPKCHSPYVLRGISLAQIPSEESLFCDNVKITSHDHEVKTTEQQSIELSCSAKGYPYPTVTISRTDQPATTSAKSKNDTKLQISQVKVSDSGIYVCKASGCNDEGISRAVSINIKLTVYRNPGSVVTIVLVSLFFVSIVLGVAVWFYRTKYKPKAAYDRLTNTHYDVTDVATSAMYNAESIHHPVSGAPEIKSVENRYNHEELEESDSEDVVAEYTKDTEFLV